MFHFPKSELNEMEDWEVDEWFERAEYILDRLNNTETK